MYFSEFDHLNLKEPIKFTPGQPIARGQPLATVFRPGGRSEYLPEVHWEVWEGTAGSRMTWKRNKFGGRYSTDATARLVVPLYLLSLDEPPRDDLNVDIHPYDPESDYSRFSGFTYILSYPRLAPSTFRSRSADWR